MSAVSVDGLGISASCPDKIPINTTTSSQGSITYTLVNSGTEDALVDVLAEIVDSEGHSIRDARTFMRVVAGESSDIEHTLVLPASYEQPGRIVVTVRLQVTGAATLSDSTECGFDVDP